MVMTTLERRSRLRAPRAVLLWSVAAAVVALGVGSAGLAPSATVAAARAPAEGAAVAEAVPSDVAGSGAEVVVGETGNVEKREGEAAGLTDEAGRHAYFSITVEGVSVRSSCPARAASVSRPDRRYFLAVDVSASMSAEIVGVVDGGADVFMPVTADAFRVLDADGVERGGPSPAAWACFEESDLAAPFVAPGESTRGLVVLESDVATGWVAYQPVPGSGWQWAFEE